MPPATWSLPTATSEYVVALAPEGLGLLADRWGAGAGYRPPERIAFETLADVLPLELTAAGTRHVQRADLLVERAGGRTGARLHLVGVPELTRDATRTHLTAVHSDETGALHVTLHVETDTGHDVVAKWALIENVGDAPIRLTRAFGPSWELDVGPGARVEALVGAWSREFTPVVVDLPAGTYAVGSRSGVTSHLYAPVVAVGPRTGAGPVFGIALAWSGSWQLTVDAVPFRGRVRVGAGVDDETGVVLLEPGGTFETPRTLGISAPSALGLPTAWHDYQRAVLRRDATTYHHPIVYNSWYATKFDVRGEHQLTLARQAADLGVEVFVVDDGWFRDRNSDRAGLGDWDPDPATFPDGLGPLVDAVRDLGLRFGLWVEPEAVNPDSDLFRAHPDWVYSSAERPLVTVRNQYVLDLGRPEVEAWVADLLRRLLTDQPITYLKWDMNRPISDGGRPGDPYGAEWSIQHTRAYYRLMDMLRQEFGHVTVEACAGGGGRVDLAVLARCDVVWASDETGPRDRLAIQHGFLAAYSASWLSSWVTDEPDRLDPVPTSWEFRFLVAMCGVLGIGGDLGSWTPEQLGGARDLVALYTEIRPAILDGVVTRHGLPGQGQYAVQYDLHAPDGGVRQCVVLAFSRGGVSEPVRLSGLDAAATYRLAGTDRAVTGAEAAAGIEVPYRIAADADLLVLDRLP